MMMKIYYYSSMLNNSEENGQKFQNFLMEEEVRIMLKIDLIVLLKEKEI